MYRGTSNQIFRQNKLGQAVFQSTEIQQYRRVSREIFRTGLFKVEKIP